MKLWQLKNPITGEKIGNPQPLPENWMGIFGMENVKDKLGDLTWVGIKDRAWEEVEVPDPVIEIDYKAIVDSQIQHLLNESLPMVAFDNPSLTKGEIIEWMEYRKQLQEISLQVGYPKEIYWPKKPD